MLSDYSIGKIVSLAALLGLLAAIPAAGQFVQEPPPELSFLSTILKVRKNIPYEAWGGVKFPPYGEDRVARQGKHWVIMAETAHGTDPLTEWNKVKPAFLQNGWTLVKEIRSGAFVEVLQYAKNGVQAWANVDPGGQPNIMSGRDRSRSAALYSDSRRPGCDSGENRNRKGRLSVSAAAGRIEIS